MQTWELRLLMQSLNSCIYFGERQNWVIFGKIWIVFDIWEWLDSLLDDYKDLIELCNKNETFDCVGLEFRLRSSLMGNYTLMGQFFDSIADIEISY